MRSLKTLEKCLLAAKAHVQRQIRQGILGILVLEVNGLADAHICDISRNAKIEVLLKEAGKDTAPTRPPPAPLRSP